MVNEFQLEAGTSVEEEAVQIPPRARVRLYWGTDRKFGEAFERFYKREILQRTGSQLGVIAAEPLLAIKDSSLISETLADREPLLLQRAEQLAVLLFDLTSTTWESNPNIYLRTIDRSIDQLSCAESPAFHGYVPRKATDQMMVD